MRTLLIFSAIVLLSACNGSEAGNEAQEAQQYELLTIQQSDFEYNTVYSATVRGLNDIAILPKIEGYIDGVFVIGTAPLMATTVFVAPTAQAYLTSDITEGFFFLISVILFDVCLIILWRKIRTYGYFNQEDYRN